MYKSKKDFDAQLKADSSANGFKIQGNYIVFDKSATLAYQPVPGYSLGDLLTHNPVSSYTKLNKDLLLRLNDITEAYGSVLKINSSYRSPEYNMTVPGSSPTSLHCQGDALDLGTSDPEALFVAIDSLDAGGELGTYNWGCHTAIKAGAQDYWDRRTDQTFMRKVKDTLEPDTTRNWIFIGALALVGFFIVKRIF